MGHKERRLLFIILGAAFLVRLIGINIPILEGTATRQTQTAGIARYFFETGFNILYPKLYNFVGDAGYLVLEFPLYNAIFAFFCKISGGFHEWIGRFISILFFMGSGFFVFLITKRIFDYKTALVGLFAYLFSPLGIIFSRTIMPDSEMLFFAAGALFFFFYFLQEDKRWSFWVSAVFAMVSLLVKPQSFYIMLVISCIMFYRQGRRCFADYRNYIFFLVVLVPAALWYHHCIGMHSVHALDRIKTFQLSNWFNLKLFASADFYKDILDITSGVLLTPVGFVLFLLGLAVKPRNKIERILYLWLAAMAAYAFIFNGLLWEPYYYLSFLPIAAIFIARASSLFMQSADQKSYLFGRAGKIAALCILVLLISRHALYAYVVPAGYRYIPEAAKTIKSISGPDELVVVSYQSGSSSLLYYCGRKGWLMNVPEGRADVKALLTIERLEEFKNKGAVYFLSADTDNFSNDMLEDSLTKKYTLIESREKKYFIYKLKK